LLIVALVPSPRTYSYLGSQPKRPNRPPNYWTYRIRERLLAAHFSEEPLGNDKPPATHYQFSETGTDFFAEFLTPLSGSEYDRHGKRKVTKRIAGVVSQQLRHLEILLQVPWSVDLDESKGFPLPSRCTVQVANPGAFLGGFLIPSSHRVLELLFSLPRKVAQFFHTDFSDVIEQSETPVEFDRH
jgi:hypothetical protein